MSLKDTALPSDERRELQETDSCLRPQDDLLVQAVHLLVVDEDEEAVALECLGREPTLLLPIDIALRTWFPAVQYTFGSVG